MKALVKYDCTDNAVEIREIPEPTITSDQVQIEVRTVGVCGSDIHLWRNHQSWPINVPLVLGHEFAGVLAKVGKDVVGFEVGVRVVCETAAEVCGRCTFCLSGNYNLCPHRKGYGNLVDGALTRHVRARPQILHRIPGNVSFEEACLTEPVCVAYNAIVEKTSLVRPGDLVVIQGVGAIGIMVLQIARLRGVGTIIVLGTDLDERRLKIAKQLGARYAINVQKEDPGALIRTLGDGFGADLIVDTTGVSVALKQALELVRPNGRITKIGWGPQPLGFNLDPLVAKAVTLQGSFSHTFPTWERVLGLFASRQLDMSQVIGGVYPLKEWEAAFTAMQNGLNVKSVITMGDA